MNILVIPSWYPNGTDKLMGIYHKEFCEALSKCKDIYVNMLYIDRQRLNAPLKYITMKKEEVIQENGYQVYIQKMLDVHKISFDLQMKSYVCALDKAFQKYLKNNKKPDILHAQVTIPAGYAACVLGEKYHIPVVVTEHASYFTRFFEGEYKKYGDFVATHSKYTTVSKYMAKIVSKYVKECTVLPNLVDTLYFNKTKREKVDGIRLIQVAGLRQGKRIDDTIEALKEIREDGYDATLTVVGDGFLEDYYKKRCTELEMNSFVNFVGRKNKAEIRKLFGQHNIFVISSDKETFAIPGIEALASGLPVVSTKCLGPEEYLDSKCGELVDVGDTHMLKEKILKVYHNMDKYDVSYLKEVASRYGSKSVTDMSIKIYNSLLK